MKKTTLLIIILVLQLWITLAARAQLQQGDYRQSLRGLTGVYVDIQIVDQQPGDITVDSIKKVVRDALTTAAIPVQSTPQKANGNANLSIVVNTIKQAQLGIYAFTVNVSLTQDVSLSRLPRAEGMPAETWRKNLQGITTLDRTDVINLALKSALNYFTTDYRAMNPK